MGTGCTSCGGIGWLIRWISDKAKLVTPCPHCNSNVSIPKPKDI